MIGKFATASPLLHIHYVSKFFRHKYWQSLYLIRQYIYEILDKVSFYWDLSQDISSSIVSYQNNRPPIGIPDWSAIKGLFFWWETILTNILTLISEKSDFTKVISVVYTHYNSQESKRSIFFPIKVWEKNGLHDSSDHLVNSNYYRVFHGQSVWMVSDAFSGWCFFIGL